MNCFLLEAICLVCILSVAHGLTCYGCSSTESFLVCNSNQREMDCPSVADRCGKILYNSSPNVTGYMKTCIPESYCDKKGNPRCQGESAMCEIHCCQGNLCNASSISVVSGLLLLACSVLILLH